MKTTLAWTVVLTLALPPAVWAQSAPAAKPAATTGTLPTTGDLPPPGDPPPPNLTEAPPIPPESPRPLPVHRKKAWLTPVVIALEAGALGFAVASVVVVSTGGKDDTYRYPLAGGLGAGVIACAGVGIIIELVAR